MPADLGRPSSPRMVARLKGASPLSSFRDGVVKPEDLTDRVIATEGRDCPRFC